VKNLALKDENQKKKNLENEKRFLGYQFQSAVISKRFEPNTCK
jgi:hypothetical protein